MSILAERLKKIRKQHKLTQKDVADFLGMTESGYGYYEQDRNKPSLITLKKLAEKYNVSVSYFTDEADEKNNVSIAGKEIQLSPDELKIFEELRKHPILFNDLASDPESKVKELIKLYKMKKMFLEDDEEEYGEGFGDIED
ncbi:helix-turn-helix transcriptional regulator [Robertmurraya massiliosenegalensis]|uniref:helix-turn-helix domain-containing protein n=1 Tax=Robertmurraya TaxID=2837507 RepID=UPI0039A5092E